MYSFFASSQPTEKIGCPDTSSVAAPSDVFAHMIVPRPMVNLTHLPRLQTRFPTIPLTTSPPLEAQDICPKKSLAHCCADTAPMFIINMNSKDKFRKLLKVLFSIFFLK